MKLLTKAEYVAIAEGLDPPTSAFIDDGFRPSDSGKAFASTNPATGATIANVADCGADDVDFAVLKARGAFDDGRWSKRHPSGRKDILIRLAKLINRNVRKLAVLESIDSGKTIYDCETVDLPETIHCLKWHAEAIDKIYDQISPASDDHFAMVVCEPVGVVGLVLPWNFPLLILAWKIGPALGAGCSVVEKSAEETSLSTFRIAELAMEAGLPRGVLNVVTAGADDAENFDRVVQLIVNEAFWSMSENCSAAARLIVYRSVKPDILERTIHHMNEWNTGDPLDPITRLGALVSTEHFDKVSSYSVKASDVVVGGLAKDTVYGLCASVFTDNAKRVIRAARNIRAGTVTVNNLRESDIWTPFGGYKQSGFGGCDNGVHAHDQYIQLKTIWMDLADDADEAVD